MIDLSMDTLKEIKKKYANITEKQVTLFISDCEEYKWKWSKPKNSSKLVVKPALLNDFNARGQVDLIDMQSYPDPYNFILDFLDIFTIIGPSTILQSDNGREFIARVMKVSENCAWTSSLSTISRICQIM